MNATRWTEREMNQMIEQGAKALATQGTEYPDIAWARMSEDRRESYRRLATRVIAAAVRDVVEAWDADRNEWSSTMPLTSAAIEGARDVLTRAGNL